jgi:hypothetical protein
LFAYGGDDVVEAVQLPMLQEALGHCTVTGQRAQNHAGKPFQTNTVSLPRKNYTKKRKTKGRVRVRVRVRAHGPKSTKPRRQAPPETEDER